jgi:hypothetical protein
MAASKKVDYSKAFAKKDFQFIPFLPKTAVPLVSTKLRPDEDILILERGGERYAFILTQMAYHHIAQGALAGQPYLVSF